MRNEFLLIALLMLVAPVCAHADDETQADQIKLSLTITLRHGPPVDQTARDSAAAGAPAATVFDEGEPIDVAFTITNVGETPFEYEDRNYDRSGRMQEYQLRATDATGQPADDPRELWDAWGPFGGRFGRGEIGPGHSFTKHIWLNEWVMPLAPGRYTVMGAYYPAPWPFVEKQSWVKSPPVEIEVLPRTETEMAAWVEELGADVVAAAEMAREVLPQLPDWRLALVPRHVRPPGEPIPPPDPEQQASAQAERARVRAEPAVRYLGFTGSPLALPYLIETSYGLFDRGYDGFMYMRDKQACEDALLTALDERGATSMGWYLLYRLGVPEERTLPRTLEWLADADPARRADAAKALARYRESGEVPLQALLGAVDDEDPYVRRAVVYALDRFPADEATTALLSASLDPDENVRAAAARTLRPKRGPTVIPRLQELLQDVARVALQAVDNLASFDTPAAAAALRTGLNAADQDVRVEVALILFGRGDDSVREILADALASSDVHMGSRMTTRLGIIGKQRGLGRPKSSGHWAVDRDAWLHWLREPPAEP